MTRDEAVKIFGTMLFSAETKQQCPLGTHEEVAAAIKMAIEALQKPVSETEILRKIQQECNQNLTCTGCRFQGIDEYDFRSCKMHVPACWIIDEQEAAAEDAQDTIPVRSGEKHDMQ